jgi:ERI1 exoribonuclease 2
MHKRIENEALRARLEDYIDCQQLFCERMHTRRLYRLFEALALTDTMCTDREHDALEDARNTAALFAGLQREERLPLNRYYLTQEEMAAQVFDPFKARSAV